MKYLTILVLSMLFVVGQATIVQSCDTWCHTLPGCAAGCYVSPAYVQEHHVYRNVGQVYSSFYAWVRLPSGHRTQIKVINGNLPVIYAYEDGDGRFVRLVLDYGYGFKYYNSSKGYVQYNVGSHGNNLKAPAPQNPNLPADENRGSNGENVPKAPAPQNPNLELEDHGSEIQAPAPQRLDDSEIDQILNSRYGKGPLKMDEEESDDGMRRPSEVTHPEDQRTINFPRYK